MIINKIALNVGIGDEFAFFLRPLTNKTAVTTVIQPFLFTCFCYLKKIRHHVSTAHKHPFPRTHTNTLTLTHTNTQTHSH